MNLTFEVVENGYVILNNGTNWIEQKGYIPYPAETLEQSAQLHIDALLADAEASVNQAEELTNLKEQNKALTEKTDFHEELIAEMAMLVYQ